MQQLTNEEKIEFDYFDRGLIKRKFTPEWATQGVVNIDNLHILVKSLCTQRTAMVKYIEELHNKIDSLIKDNNLCPFCHKPNCGSDHK